MNGLVEYSYVFDTYKSSYVLEQFINNVSVDMPHGFIIVAVCKDECSKKLTDNCKDWFRGIGSKQIDKLKYRHSFAFIG